MEVDGSRAAAIVAPKEAVLGLTVGLTSHVTKHSVRIAMAVLTRSFTLTGRLAGYLYISTLKYEIGSCSQSLSLW